MEFVDVWANKKRDALKILQELGAINFVKDMDLYHGRAGDGESWRVNPQINNAGNNTGNSNVYNISGLYTASKEIAMDFAKARTSDLGGSPEVHKIVGVDEDAIVFNSTFKLSSLSKDQRTTFYSAMKTLSNLTVTDVKPVKFEYRNIANKVFDKCQEVLKNNNAIVISGRDARAVVKELEQDRDVFEIFNGVTDDLTRFVMGYVRAFNTKKMLSAAPIHILKQYKNGTEYVELNDGQTYPISSEYVSAWCSHNHVVGTKDRVRSATLNEKEIDTCHLFDTKKIMSEKQHGEYLHKMLETYSNLSTFLRNVVGDDIGAFLSIASAQEIIEFVNQDNNLKVLLDKDSGISEGWTVGQHTQSVIDFFERYYTDEIPDALKPFLKISMLAHDLGKGLAVEENINQKQGTLKVIDKLFNYLEVPYKYRSLITFVITESQDFTTAIALKQGDKSQLENALSTACLRAYNKAFDASPTASEIEALKNLCIMLQQCDSGAYTRYAAIQEGTKFVAGGNDGFTKNFELDAQGKPRLSEFMPDGM